MENKFSVYVRVRPLIAEDAELYYKQAQETRPPICTKCAGERILYLVKPHFEDRKFEFDRVLGPAADQADSYNLVGKGVVNEVLAGYNGTIMAYGQTGSGKTFTVFGSRDALEHYSSEEDIHSEAGIVPRSVQHVFDYIRERIDDVQFKVTVSFLQIYLEVINDLLDPANQNLHIREDPRSGIFVDGLTQQSVMSQQELLILLQQAAKSRSTGTTSMNRSSSRSHAVLQIFLEQRWLEEEGPNKKRKLKRGLLTIVDLAGSERLGKSGSEGLRQQEAKIINKSISALGNCISTLSSEAATKSMAHVPFRDSKLTRLLTESLGGNSKTSIYACVGPSLLNFDETYSTLHFATRAMRVRTYVRLNETTDLRPATPEQYIQKAQFLESKNIDLQREVDTLKMKLQSRTPSPIPDRSTSQTYISMGSFLQDESDTRVEDRERELVVKFTRMIRHLQKEIIRQQQVIAQLCGGKEVDLLLDTLVAEPVTRKKLEAKLSVFQQD
mmetsp:Transcript_7201/g.13218  ORF Transcript_7201/g.13218 Transcript_7201/m.13218 type:complete len:498 (-) Transcript_7201:142-1635(-)